MSLIYNNDMKSIYRNIELNFKAHNCCFMSKITASCFVRSHDHHKNDKKAPSVKSTKKDT